MTKSATILTVLGGGAVLVVVGLVLGWLGSQGTPETEAPPPPAPVEAPSTNAIKFAKTRPGSLETPVIPNNELVPAASPVTTNQSNAWEERLEEILRADSKDADKARQLLELFPNLPENGQVEVAEHLSNLVGDAEFGPLGSLLTNSALPEAVLDVLMADLLNRPNSLKLPLILEVARNPQHPKATEAKDLLALYLEEDLEQDWPRWQARMDQWLRDNPD